MRYTWLENYQNSATPQEFQLIEADKHFNFWEFSNNHTVCILIIDDTNKLSPILFSFCLLGFVLYNKYFILNE